MNWNKLKFEDIFADVSGGSRKVPQAEYLSEGSHAVVDQGKKLIAGYSNDVLNVSNAQPPVIVFGDHTRVLKYVDFSFCMGADGIKVLKPKIDADTKYLYYALQNLHIPNNGYDRHFKYLKRFQIPLPPLAEQKRIAAILDKADATRAKRRQTLAHLDALLQSVFLEIFGDPVTNPKGWSYESLGKLGKVSTGNTPPSSQTGMFDGAIPFVTPGDLESNETVKRTVTEAGASMSRTVRQGAALVCCIGTIGKMDIAKEQSAFNQQINAVEWFDTVNDLYGLEVLRFFKPTIKAWGASTTVPILKKSSFEKLQIPVPPIPIQRDFAQKMLVIKSLRAKSEKSLSETTKLFDALQRRAFSGEL